MAFALTSDIVGADMTSYCAGSGYFLSISSSDISNRDGLSCLSSFALALFSSTVSFFAGSFFRLPFANVLSLSLTSLNISDASVTPPLTLLNSNGSCVCMSILTTIALFISATLKPRFFRISLIDASEKFSARPNSIILVIEFSGTVINCSCSPNDFTSAPANTSFSDIRSTTTPCTNSSRVMFCN